MPSPLQTTAALAETATAPPKELRGVRQRRIHEALLDAAMVLFSERGYEATTIIDIATQVGISRRTFFRYFKAKDDLLFNWLDQQGELISTALNARPTNEHPSLALQHAYLQFVSQLDSHDERIQSQIQLIINTPSLLRRYNEENTKWEQQWMAIIQGDTTLSDDEILALQIHISTTTTAFLIAVRQWTMSKQNGSFLTWTQKVFSVYNNSAALSVN